MIDQEQTVEEFNAREKRRASIVARLHGYTPWESGDTEEGLKTAFREITGEPYRSREEEQADNLQAAKERRQQRVGAQLDGDHAIIAEAKANGFKDCVEVFDALGFDSINASGIRRNTLQVASRWIQDAEVEFVYLIPDGHTDIPKNKRTGCYDVAAVVAYKEAYYARLRHAEWKRAYDSAVETRDKYGAQTKNMDWDAYIEGLGPEPPLADEAIIAVVEERRRAKVSDTERAEAEQVEQSDESDKRIVAALRAYDGPLNKRGLPPKRALNAHAGFPISGDDKRRLWPRANADG